jgi:hypothetical protein
VLTKINKDRSKKIKNTKLQPTSSVNTDKKDQSNNVYKMSISSSSLKPKMMRPSEFALQ